MLLLEARTDGRTNRDMEEDAKEREDCRSANSKKSKDGHGIQKNKQKMGRVKNKIRTERKVA